MSIALEYFNLIIPISVIDRKYPGGWARCREEHGLQESVSSFGACQHDGELFRDGAMNQFDLAMMVERWTSLGFKATKRRDGQKVAADFCIYATFSDAPVHPCEWLKIDTDQATASFAAPSANTTSRGALHG